MVLFIVPTFRTGQTLGKRLTYLMCVDRATGDLCSPRQVLIRYVGAHGRDPLVLLPMGPSPFVALFFGFSYAMGRDQVSLADRMAKTQSWSSLATSPAAGSSGPPEIRETM